MRNLFRKIFLWLGAFFWSRRFRIASVVASSFALQAFACTYGTDEPCEKDCYDPSLDCKPVYDIEKFSGKDYSECERTLADSVTLLTQCKSSIPDCSYETINVKQLFVDSLEWNCPLDHLKADSSLFGYECVDEHKTISIEEGEKRRQEYREWLKRRSSS
ncbi:MAG: hypothetical protein J6T62_00100 [Fibrobacter sp.]|nr:hypothetical protein [Fibrobacter sp.]